MIPNPKKILINSVLKLVSIPIIRRPLAALMNQNPKLKQIINKVFIKLLMGPQNTDASMLRGRSVKTAQTYGLVLDSVLEKNRFNDWHTRKVNRLVIALKEKDREVLDLHTRDKDYPDLIVSCYLFILRRYPSQEDIKLWTDHLIKGATAYTILNALENSLEFQLTGACYLPDAYSVPIGEKKGEI